MDYLELAIEAGLAGLLLLVGWLGWMLFAGWQAVHREAQYFAPPLSP